MMKSGRRSRRSIVLTTSRQGTSEITSLGIFAEVNPDCQSQTAFRRGVPMAGGGAHLSEQTHVTEEVRAKAVEGLIPNLSRYPKAREFGITPIYERANPKGVKSQCEICFKPAALGCTGCGVTYYCGYEHSEKDVGYHSKMCQKLRIIRTPAEFTLLHKDRQRELAQRNLIAVSLLEDTFCNAVENMFQGNTEQAVSSFNICVSLIPKTYGTESSECSTVLIYLSDALMNHGQQELAMHTAILGKQTLTELQQVNKGNNYYTTWALMNRTQGRLEMAEGRHRKAIDFFAESVYLMAEAFGAYHVRVCSAYVNLAVAFLAGGRRRDGVSLLTFVVDIWRAYLEDLLNPLLPDDDVMKQRRVLTAQGSSHSRGGPKAWLFLEMECKAQLMEIEPHVRFEEDPTMFCKTTLCLAILDILKDMHADAKFRIDATLEALKMAPDKKLKKFATRMKYHVSGRPRKAKP